MPEDNNAEKIYRDRVAGIDELPTLPTVVMNIMEILDDPSASAKKLTDAMEQDPAMVSKILKLVNSAYYALPNRISHVRQAIVILGFSTIKSLAISASVVDMFSGSEFDVEGFWTHCMGVAAASKYLGQKTPGIDEEDCFVLGLLHDVGKLVMDQYFSDMFAKAFSQAEQNSCSFYSAEKESIDTNHAELGSYLVEKWKLPETMINYIKYHHEIDHFENVNDKKVVAVNRVSNYACVAKHTGSNGDAGDPEYPTRAFKVLGLSEEAQQPMLESLYKEIKKAKDLFQQI